MPNIQFRVYLKISDTNGQSTSRFSEKRLSFWILGNAFFGTPGTILTKAEKREIGEKNYIEDLIYSPLPHPQLKLIITSFLGWGGQA